ncbi:MAG: xanthine dehydrogenase small subunit [Rhodospirillales bacterium]|nr:xanthine dehydrogenase small subunit [Rhodospirillales bacterium]
MTAETRSTVRLLLGWTPVDIAVADSNQTVLQYLRDQPQLKGSKEGCAEGDCGACTVVVGALKDGAIRYSAVNACILFLPAMDGKQILSVEQVADTELHPVQQALVELHGSQCGYCTPGIVNSLLCLNLNGGAADRQAIDDALIGNLCRCTGYGPIIEAAEKACSTELSAAWKTRIAAAQKQLLSWAADDQALALETRNGPYLAPKTPDQLAAALDAHPAATLVAGATDVGLWVTKLGRSLNPLISVAEVADLQSMRLTDSHLEIGAAVTYSEAHQALSEISESLGELVRRIGSRQVRNSGTIGGNIANGSPIGDMPPALIAMGASLVLRSRAGRREIPLQDFFIEYGKQDLRPGEFVGRVLVPRKLDTFRCYKVSKRFDQDITAVLGAFNIAIENGAVVSARIAYGGMAGVPARAVGCEAALTGKPWNMKTIETAKVALDADFKPMTDMRASAAYRTLAARNLLERFYLETQNPAVALELASRNHMKGLVDG